MVPHRREFLATGFGGMVLSHLLAGEQSAKPKAEFNGGLHHPAKAKRVLQIFLNGGMSQMDTFDYKPGLEKRHGQQIDLGLKATATGTPGPLMKSPFPWKQHGQSGRWVTDVFPYLAGCVDDLAFLMAMASKSNVHGPASYLQTTGFLLPGFPCAGAWVSYALGRLTDNLPTFVVLPDARGLPYNGMGNFSAGFLPASHQATVVNPAAPIPIPDLAPPTASKFVTPEASAEGLKLLKRVNESYAQDRVGDSRLTSRLESYELAARLQLSAPEAFDLSKESSSLREKYGTARNGAEGAFSRNCLISRRLLERGVRFVQLWSGAGGPSNNWDNHSNIPKELPPIARQVDQPVAALLADLKSRGLLDDTLVIFTTEFGRMPVTQNGVGRDHNGGTFVTWLAGAGIKKGVAYGASDEFSYLAEREKTTCYDLYATVLHLLGIDHEKLTVRHNGIDRRLTDVHGEVIRPILA
ncbi:DUF1501 domain-containing protein [Telmatocola sphagniphila]|uniref:DUF1501 domain-containing protein n=1 Tax=Telmatocola sphagniphila TaxID=1123043 RepID=A0A8E6EZG5_9BACT|nr:DUF1501 domain-containing protein [Telmatocola sphagniphila]QVL33728.1 DUF1501 domain-containing protein [Telmatocola sphagniphila]